MNSHKGGKGEVGFPLCELRHALIPHSHLNLPRLCEDKGFFLLFFKIKKKKIKVFKIFDVFFLNIILVFSF